MDLEKLSDEQKEQDNEIRQLGEELSKIGFKFDLKLDKTEAQKIWKEFQFYSRHDDLKNLYRIVNPEIAKFEQKIMDFGGEIEKFKLIIRRFDEDLSTKSNKH